MKYYVSVKKAASGSNPGYLGTSHGVLFNEKNKMKKMCLMSCFCNTNNDPEQCVCRGGRGMLQAG